jgi:hypothetical protein
MEEPTAEACSAGTLTTVVVNGERIEGYATWYPQMGGYGAKALVIPSGGCFDVLVWHDGEFPFGDGRKPASLHHCDARQFIEFGEFVAKLPGGTHET